MAFLKNRRLLLWFTISLAAGLFNQLKAQSTSTSTSLIINKQVDKGKANLGDTLSYIVTLTNNGSSTVNNINVRDSLGLGLRYLPNSLNRPSGSNFNQGNPISVWTISSLNAGQSIRLTYQAVADSMGVLYGRATIPGATVGICTSIPVKVCPGTPISSLLTAPAGSSGYHWFKNGSEISDQTTNVLYISSIGTYSVRIDKGNNQCNDISCCDLTIEEDPVPTFQARAIAAGCDGNGPRANGQIVLTNFNSIHTYQYSEGSSFNAGASLSGSPKRIPASGIIANNLSNPSGNKPYTVRVYNTAGCYTDYTVNLTPTTCSAQPKLAVVLTPGVCDASSNSYSVAGTISLTAAVAGTLTITDGNATTTVSIVNGQTTATFSLSGLTAGTGSHTLSIAGNGYTTITSAYSAPASCNPPVNNAPTVANVLAPQSATVGQAFSYNIPDNTFTHQDTPNNLAITVAGLPGGLSFTAPATISGTPTSIAGSPITVTVTATDARGLFVSTPLILTIYPANTTNPGTFAITSVNTLTCVSVSTTQRQLTFQPVYGGVDGSPITLSSAGALASTTASGPYTVQLYIDNPTIVLQAQQSGKTATYSYNWSASCQTAPANTAPTVANALAPQSATVGQAFSYGIPNNTFTDKETPNSLTITVAGLTNGLAFSAPATISGTPSSTLGSPLTLTVTATDAGGLSASTPLLVTIAPAPAPANTAPTVANALAPQSATVGQAFSYNIPANTFTDKETPNSLTITVAGLTNGLTFSAPATISGSPSTTVGSPLTLTVTATDAGGLSVSTPLLVTIAPAPAPANTAPTVANALAPQSATVGQAFSYNIPANTFTDKETPNSLTITVGGVTNGLAFSAPTTISGTPSSTLGSPLTLTVTATDTGGLSVSTPLLLTIAPAGVSNPTPFTITAVNTLSCVALSATQRQLTFQPTYAGLDGSPITLSSAGALASTTATGPYTVQLYLDNPAITLLAQQSGKTATYSYNWSASCQTAPANTAPTVANALAPQSATVGQAFSYNIPNNTFTDKETPNSLTITVGGVTNGLTFSAPATISGTPSTTVGSPLTLTVTATDAGGLSVSTPLLVTIAPAPAPANTAPTVANALAPQSATVGQAFSYSIPANTFTDKETPNSLTITVAGLTNGLTFSAPATISGSPSTTVGSPLTLTVTATDAGGLSASTPLLVTIAPAPAPANTAPTVANALAPQSATVGQAFSYNIPNNTFTDKETPNSLTITVAGLTNGLAFSAPATISGTPSSTLGSPLTLTVTATDAGGLSVSTPLLVTIAPAGVSNPTPFTITAVNTLSCVALSATQRQLTFQPTYAGLDGSPITLSSAGALASTTATGPYTVPLYIDNPAITLLAQQSGKTATYSYNWSASCQTAPANTAPTVANVLAPQSATVGQAFSYNIPTNTFTDKETPNSLAITVAGLTNGLTFSAPATISGSPSSTVGSPLTLTVTATDAGGLSVSTPLLVTIAPAPAPANTAPTVANALAPQSATVGQAFSYSIPNNTFTDKETPNSLTITVAGLTNGLTFSAPATISGSPSTTVGSPLTLTVTATDAGGLSASTPLLLTIAPAPAPANTAPTVANALAPQSATVGQAFSYSIPNNTFTDKETPNSLTITVAGLTNGLAFSAPATISGTPSSTLGSPLTLTVTATDAGGLSASTPLLLTIAPAPAPANTAPTVANALAPQSATVGQAFSYNIPTNTFTDKETPNSLTITVAGVTNGLAFSAPATISGTPSSTLGSPLTLTVTATDAGGLSVSTPLLVTIAPAGVSNPTPFTITAVNTLSCVALSATQRQLTFQPTYAGLDGSPITLSSAGALASTTATGPYTVPLYIDNPAITLLAQQSGKTATYSYNWSASCQTAPANTAPTVANVLAPQSATVGQAFSYSIPNNTFTDKETPNSLAITVAGLTNGLTFSAPATISGSPSSTVGSPLTLTVTATDAGGLSASTPLLLTIAPAPAPANTAPTVANALAPQSATVGQTFSYSIPNNTFTDKETPNSLTITVAGVTNGLAFSAPTTISGTPSSTVGSPLTLTVTATDAGGLSVSTPLLVTIAPAGVSNPTPFTITSVNTLSCVALSATQRQITFQPTYAGLDGSPITLSSAGALASTTATGPYTVPLYIDNPAITLLAQQSGKTATYSYNWSASCQTAPANTAPTVANVLAPQSATVGQAFSYSIPNNTFTDKETPNSLAITVAGLTNGLTFSAPATISGSPSSTVGSPLTLTVTATDAGGLSASTPLLLTIAPAPAPANTAPTVANALAPQSATVGQTFSYSIPNNTFTDKETPNSLTITVAGVTNGLAFSAPTTISGTPSSTVGSPLTLTVTATDAGGLSVSTPLLLTIAPAAITNPTPFTITAVNTLSCVALSATQRQITFQPAYAGLDGSPVSFSVVNELLPTTETGPYTLKLYTDNPTITLQAQQSAQTASIRYNWLANCSVTPVNTAPTVANALAPQSATVGQAFSYNIPANTFTDKETPNSLTITVAGLTNGLTFSAPATISGTPSSTVGSPLTLTVTATDAGGLSVSTPLLVTIAPAPITNPTPFTITAVNTLSCVALSATQRQITFQPAYAGLDGSPVSLSVVNEMLPTTNSGPYTLKLYTDNPIITLQAQQSAQTASYTYSWLASCGNVGNSAPTAASAITVSVTPGSCDPTTNNYSITGAINLTAATAGTLVVTDGASTTMVSIANGQTSARFTLIGLLSGTGSHTVTITGTDYPTASTTYTAPESCTIGVAISATAGVCNALSNQYDLSGVLSLTNAQNGVATITDGTYSTTVSVATGDQSVPYSLTGLSSGTGNHTITVDYLSHVASTTYSAPGSCSVSPVCSLTTSVTPGVCDNVTNTYSATVAVNVSNSTTGVMTVSNGTQSFTFATPVTPSATFTAVLTGLISDGASHTIVTSLPNCSTVITAYTAPFSCTQPIGSQVSLLKQVDKSKAYMGDTLSYTLILTNTSNTTVTNVTVRDSATTGLTYVTNSATAPAGTTFVTGTSINSWLIASISPAQSLTLTLKARADSTGILHSTATIPGDTATVCTTIPVKVCAGDEYLYRLTAPLGYATYQWYRDGQAILGATTNSLDVSTPGSYSLAVDNAVGQCPDFSCCPFIIEEDSLPKFQLVALSATCIGNKPQSNGQLVLSNFQTSYTYQYSAGATFNEAAPLSGSAQLIPATGIIANTLLSPAVEQAYTVRVYNSSGCYTDVTVMLQPTVCGCPAEICVPFVIQQTKRGPRLGETH